MEREEKGLVRDPMLETAYQDVENLRDSLQQAQEKLLRSESTLPFTETTLKT